MNVPNTGAQISAGELLARLGVTEEGLSSTEAEARLKRFGANEPATARRITLGLQLFKLFANPLVLILLIASGLSAFLGEVISASIIVLIVLLGIGLNFLQTYRSQRAIARLRERVAPTATTLRDGNWQEVPRRAIVPGDIIQLVAGDLVPADARLLRSKDLYVQQSALTGEPMPVEKEAGELQGRIQQLTDLRNTVFLGTSIVSGTARALVELTGPSTVFGGIASGLAAAVPETELERGSRRFSLFIMQTVLFLVLFVFLVSIALRHDPLQSLLFAVALAVGLTPEFLPMIIAVTLAQGAVHMARRKVIVKHLAAMQNLGSMDILCSDKTGTLTTGQITLVSKLDPLGQASEDVFLPAYLNSLYETGIKSPLDTAILNSHAAPESTGHKKLDEMPFDFERRRLSVVVEHNGERQLIAKGAPEGILPICAHYQVDGQAFSLDPEARARAVAVFQDLGMQGLRVLAVASAVVPAQEAYHVADEKDLTLLGFLGFLDPPIEDAREMLDELHEDGVRVLILTGDNELVARHLCEQVGLDSSQIVLGQEVDHLDDSSLAQVAERTSIFARATPAQKNRVIRALKQRGHVLGFLGDGINDAPSLHAADVGISVASAVDVAKDAAEVILLEPGLQVLHSGIIQGRQAFGNVMKYLLMGTSSNFGNMFSMAAASLFLPFLPMLPPQILLNNFLYDLAQVAIPTDNVDATFIRKPRRWDIGLIRRFMILIGPISSLFDFLTFAALLTIFRGSEAHFHTGWFVESLATQTLVLFVIRTAGNPFKSRPSRLLTFTVLAVVIVGAALPFTSLGPPLGFTPMPLGFHLFLIAATSAYLFLVELAKRRLMPNPR